VITGRDPVESDPGSERYSVEACAALIRFDTSNYGSGESRGERAAADFVAGELTTWGYSPEVLESEPGRASTVVRISGTDPDAPALLVHGHLDVVPAEAADWSVDPFGGEVRDGAVWGRGALDMKGMDAMMLSVARRLAMEGIRPPRDVVMAFVADEEDTGRYGAGYLVDAHPGLFDGVKTAIGESGGTLTRLPDGSHLYPIATGERGTAWMTLTARGTAGHGSRQNPDNAVTTLARTVASLAAVEWPVRVIPTMQALLDGLSDRLGVPIDPAEPSSLDALGDARRLLETTLRNSLNPTVLSAGYKANAIPSEARAQLDGRILPGLEEEFFATVDALLPESVTRRLDSHSAPVSAPESGGEIEAMAAALGAHDPEALVLPFLMGGGTDAKSFGRLGIACYGFTPGVTPVGFSADRYVHGVDEHVPVESLRFGTRVLYTFICQPPRVHPCAKER
jgi:acetylornithine deacetylase/succinyl-diaminopimelate desuccinylase-like protein